MIIGISGHREIKRPLVTYNKVIQELIETKPDLVIIGGAKGFDMLVMLCCFVLNIPYKLYLPFKDFVSNDTMLGGISYKELVEKALEVSYEADRYMHNGLYMQRNKKIVDGSDWMLVYWNNKPSGTGNTIKYANTKNLQIKNIYE